MKEQNPDFAVALVAGGAAGLSVDISLYPLDTIKTRLQSAKGFVKSGGFRGIYSGLPSVVVGSVPTAATFFCTYEAAKHVLGRHIPESWHFVSQSTAASFGEVAACIVRVPVEVVKQRAQASPNLTSMYVFRSTLKQEGFRGFFRGYWSTVMREIPFSALQLPIWEFTKKLWSRKQGYQVQPWQSSICGAFAGAAAAGITTPFDVAKTRIMLAEVGTGLASGNMLYALQVVYKERGVSGLFAGIVPRTVWIAIGGAIFLGVYDKVSYILKNDVGFR